MKKLVFTLGFIGLGIFATAQQQPAKVDSVFLKNWMHSDFAATGVYGVNTQKALDFLAEKKRKPSNIVVAVVDSGVEYFHEDLKNNMWVNPKEKDKNAKDDDKNGFVDDVHGWNFVTDKEGKSYAADTYEVTRQYAKYAKKFERSLAAKQQDPEGYKKYLDLKKEYFSTITRYKLNKEVAGARLSYVQPRMEALNKAFGDQILTKTIVDDFKSEDPLALEGLFIFH